jgi:hypothetical protein
MVNDSRMGIYEYVESLLVIHDNKGVTDNVYLMNEPQELTQSDTEDGFIVIRVGDLNDASEFQGEAYGWARVFVQCYVPPITRGRLDKSKYKAFEDSINEVIKDASTNDNQGTYWIQGDSVLSMDSNDDNNANNAYYMFVKSFIVMIDEETLN